MSARQPAEEALPRIDFGKWARRFHTRAESSDGAPRRASLEILRPARELADSLATSVRDVVRVYAYWSRRSAAVVTT
jgi:hypothetical protein